MVQERETVETSEELRDFMRVVHRALSMIVRYIEKRYCL